VSSRKQRHTISCSALPQRRDSQLHVNAINEIIVAAIYAERPSHLKPYFNPRAELPNVAATPQTASTHSWIPAGNDACKVTAMAGSRDATIVYSIK